MNKPMEHGVTKAVDSVQQRLTAYACGLNYDDISAEAIHAAKVRIIDTLGALVGGFFGEPCQIARNLAAQMPSSAGATIIGTRMKVTPDMAAFVNGTTARCVEMNDLYHWPGSFGGHPSDTLTPVLAAAEYVHASGREFITGVVLAYEIYQRFCDVFHNPGKGFDHTNLCCLGTAVAAGKTLGLASDQLAHCISMAAVPNVILGQVRAGHLTMWKAVASGHAGRAGVFAALLARAGMAGPHLPFEGKAGWCDHVAGKRFVLSALGGGDTPFKISDSRIKPRASCSTTISSIMAAEKVAPFKNTQDVERVTVEVYKKAKEGAATGEHRWNPDSGESADHSVPYVVAATLIDGTVTPRSFNDAHLWNPQLRSLMQKIEVVENQEFTKAYARMEHRTRVTIVTSGGSFVGEAGGDSDDLSSPKSDAQIVEKFRGLSEDVLGAKRVESILECLWNLEDLKDVAAIPPAFLLA